MTDRYASLKQGLVGCWIPSISGSGLLLPDLSGRGNNGVLTNMDASDWVSGQYGRALDFDGVNDFVDTNARYNGQFISVSCWAKIGFSFNANNFPCFIGALNDAGSAGWVLYYSTSIDKFQFFVGTNLASSAAFSPQIINDTDLKKDVWQHLCGTCDGQVVKLFRDGTEVGTANFSGTYGTSVSTVRIGDNNDFSGASGPCLAALDDIRVYSRALSESEIRLLASSPGIGFKPAKKLSRFSQRFTYRPPKAKVFEGVRVRDHDYASLRQGLVGAWCPSLPNGGSGNTLPDVSGYGNHGTLTNMGPEDWVSGQYGRALDFDGVNDYVNCGTIPAKNPLDLTSKLTLSAWVYIRSAIAVGDTQVIVERGAYGQSANYSLTISGTAANGLSFQMNNSFFYALEALPIASWLHVCGSFDGSSGSIYYAGVRKNSGTLNAPASGTASLMLGSRQGTLYFQDGQLDDIRIYNRALSEPEIRLLASRPGIGLQPSPTRFIAREKKTGLRRKILTGQT